MPRFVQLNSSRTEIEWGDVKTRKVCALLPAPVPRAPSTSHPLPAPLQMTSSLPISECKRVLYGEPSETFKGFTFRPHELTSSLHPATHTALTTSHCSYHRFTFRPHADWLCFSVEAQV